MWERDTDHRIHKDSDDLRINFIHNFMPMWRIYCRQPRSVCNAGDVSSKDIFLMTMITEGVISNKGGAVEGLPLHRITHSWTNTSLCTSLGEEK